MARTDPQINFRIPEHLKVSLDAAAASNGRSLTAEIVARLDQSFDGDTSDAGIRLALKTLADTIKGLGDEAEGLMESMEAMAAIAAFCAAEARDGNLAEKSREALASSANLARILTTVSPERSFGRVRDELLRLAGGVAGNQPTAPGPAVMSAADEFFLKAD